MANSIFSESGLRFIFPAEWKVIKYDEHRFYRYLSGYGLKGVDFIIIHGEELILMEVKNYSDRTPLDRYDPMETLLNDPKKHVTHYLRKFEDSIRLLDIIEQYYQRRWWYKFYLRFFRSKELKREVDFWTKAFEILDKMESVKLVLWMELSEGLNVEKAAGIYDYFENVMKYKVPENAVLILAHSAKPYQNISILKEND